MSRGQQPLPQQYATLSSSAWTLTMGLKKNILYSGFLTTGLYLSQIVTYPYITRTLGAANLGHCNFVQSYVQFFLLFSALGISTLGVREIAKLNGKRSAISKRFSQLFLLNTITTIIALVVYISISFFIPKFASYHKLLFIGAFNIIFSLFNIEWFFRGIENFKYITLRILLVRLVYIALVFLLVKSENDYVIYYVLGVGSVIVNSTINWVYSKKFVTLHLQSIKDILRYLKPNTIIGIQMLLLSYNSTINPVLLGMLCNDMEVGFFTTASKLTVIILLFYNAYTLALMPRISALMGNDGRNNAISLVEKSYKLLYMAALPLVIIIEIYTPEIVLLIAGRGYEGAILPMRIALPIIIIGGISQITINQVLIPNNYERITLITACVGVIVCIVLNLVLVPVLSSVASAIAWIITEIIITVISLMYVRKYLNGYSGELNALCRYIIIYLPLICLCLINRIFDFGLMNIAVSITIMLVYIHITLGCLFKDDTYLSIIKKCKY